MRPGPLLHEQQLAARELHIPPAEAENHLKRKHNFAVHVLVQAIEIAGSVAQKKRRRPHLLLRFAFLQEPIQVAWEIAPEG